MRSEAREVGAKLNAFKNGVINWIPTRDVHLAISQVHHKRANRPGAFNAKMRMRLRERAADRPLCLLIGKHCHHIRQECALPILTLVGMSVATSIDRKRAYEFASAAQALD